MIHDQGMTVVLQHGLAVMTFSRNTVALLAVFWAALIASQYYFLYRRIESVRTCRALHVQLDTTQAQVDRLRGAGR